MRLDAFTERDGGGCRTIKRVSERGRNAKSKERRGWKQDGAWDEGPEERACYAPSRWKVNRDTSAITRADSIDVLLAS
ncbi:MAG TPA: hypothetical protein VJB14_18475 [Planctomycetota bacterium]|nr:hypothetical protein [Planctomycetota bacterium]